MKYCNHCGSELKGAKQFCIVCGARQEMKKIDKKFGEVEKAVDKDTGDEEGKCIRCGDGTDKKCFFCKIFVCRDHYTRMQANINSYADMQGFITQGESKHINEGWRGFMVYSCPKCLRQKVGKGLTEEELVEINVVDECSWFKLESQGI